MLCPLHGDLCLAHIEGEVVVLAPHCQFSDLLLIGCLIVVGDQANHFVSSANLMMVLELCLATQFLGEQGVQKVTKYTPLRSPSVEEQFVRCFVA